MRAVTIWKLERGKERVSEDKKSNWHVCSKFLGQQKYHQIDWCALICLLINNVRSGILTTFTLVKGEKLTYEVILLKNKMRCKITE